jgi:hypothetical protein
MKRLFSGLVWALWGLGLTLSACEDTVVVPPSQLLVELRSDLTAGDQLAYVRIDTLDATGDQAVQSRWLSLRAPCGDAGAMLHALGSFGVERGNRDIARLRILGFGPDLGQGIKPLIEQRVDVVFQDGPLSLTVELTQACLEHTCPNTAETCDPASGACRAIPHVQKTPDSQLASDVSCLVAEEHPPAIYVEPEPDGGPPTPPIPNPCDPSDGQCGIGCGPAQDPECGKTRGIMCAATDECRIDLTCVESFCCESACDDPCFTCSSPSNRGECVARDFAASSDVNHCGGCNVACGSENAVTAQCDSGKCGYECKEGWKDCKPGVDGCETGVTEDPQHCGGCGEEHVCKYPFCSGAKCAYQGGSSTATVGEDIEAGTAIGTYLSLPDGVLLGLGANLQNLPPTGGRVRFALYEATDQLVPGALVAQTEPVDVVDQTGTPSVGSPVSTHASVPAKQVAMGFYWLIMVSEKPIRVMSETVLLNYRFAQAGFGFELFEETIQGESPEYSVDRPDLNFVAYVVP